MVGAVESVEDDSWSSSQAWMETLSEQVILWDEKGMLYSEGER